MRASMTRIEMTIINSRSVKPFDFRSRIADCGLKGARPPSFDARARRPAGGARRARAGIRNPQSAIRLPVTVLLPVERLAAGLRAHVEDVGRAAGAAVVGRLKARQDAPVALARYRVDGNLAQVDFLLRDEAAAVGGRAAVLGADAAELVRGRSLTRDHVHAVNERLQVGRVAVDVFDVEDFAVGDDDVAARV